VFLNINPINTEKKMLQDRKIKNRITANNSRGIPFASDMSVKIRVINHPADIEVGL